MSSPVSTYQGTSVDRLPQAELVQAVEDLGKRALRFQRENATLRSALAGAATTIEHMTGMPLPEDGEIRRALRGEGG